MAKKQILSSASTIFYDTEVTEGSNDAPTSDAVFKALGDIPTPIDPGTHVFEQILMSANDKTYAITIDAEGALAVAEVEEEASDEVEEGGE